MTNSLEDEIRKLFTGMDGEHKEQPPKTEGNEQVEQIPGEPGETIHIHYFPDAIVLLKEEEQAQVVDSAPVKHKRDYMAFLPVYILLLVIFSTLAFQMYEILNPPTATVTIIPKSTTLTLSGTVQLGRILSPVTLSQSHIGPTTGKGHQDAKQATGYITFYNGQFQSVTIAAGTLLTGASSIQMVTDQDATIPAGNPPSYGHVSIAAHTIVSGTKGNIPAYDINQVFSNAVLVKNTQPFTGGQDERDFHTVATSDIDTIATQLKKAVMQSINGAFQGQLKPPEQVFILPCSPTVTSDHQPGQEATIVKVTVSQTCSAAAYNSQELTEKAATLLSHQALQKLGTGYNLFGTVHVSVTQATVTNTAKVFLSTHTFGLLVYALSLAAQQQITHLIAGKTTQEAVRLVEALPGIEHATIRLNGFGDETRLPKQSSAIHLSLCVV